MAQNAVSVTRRDQPPSSRQSLDTEFFISEAVLMLEEIQNNLFERAKAFREANTRNIDSKDEFYGWFTPKNAEKPEIHGGFALAHWCGSPQCEAKIKEDLTVTIRLVPEGGGAEKGRCIVCDRPSSRRVVFAKAY
jgi:prolyl-tRNA synthetase